MEKLFDSDGIELKLGDTVNVLYDIAPGPGNDWCGDLAGETGVLKHDGKDYYIEYQQKVFRSNEYFTAKCHIDDNCGLYKIEEEKQCHST